MNINELSKTVPHLFLQHLHSEKEATTPGQQIWRRGPGVRTLAQAETGVVSSPKNQTLSGGGFLTRETARDKMHKTTPQNPSTKQMPGQLGLAEIHLCTSTGF
jgi:hypothetical protein